MDCTGLDSAELDSAGLDVTILDSKGLEEQDWIAEGHNCKYPNPKPDPGSCTKQIQGYELARQAGP